MIITGVIIFSVSAFVGVYMLGLIPPFLGSISVRESTGVRVALISAIGVLVGLVLVMVGLVI